LKPLEELPFAAGCLAGSAWPRKFHRDPAGKPRRPTAARLGIQIADIWVNVKIYIYEYDKFHAQCESKGNHKPPRE
jgi:hypothetical protein